MANKRILVVDDSCLFQRILSEIINERDGLEVVGIASNGKKALELMAQLKPDMVTLDILMPEFDGIQTLMALRKGYPSVKTVMVSSLTSEGSDAALDALALGASEYAVKPDSDAGIGHIRAELAADLMPKIEALCDIETASPPAVQFMAPAPLAKNRQGVACDASPDSPSECQIDLIAIGVSTGGPDALTKLLSTLSGDIGVPIVIVQHMPAAFTSRLATRLDAVSDLSVVEAQQGDKLRAGVVYIAPGNLHLTLKGRGSDVICNLDSEAPENSCRPSVDPLFRSIPAVYGSNCLGVIMTGMGSDGLKGSEALTVANCPVIVQDQATSIVWGMPKLVAMAGLARQQVPLERMAEVITTWVKQPAKLNSENAANSDIQSLTTVLGRCA